MTSAEVFKEDLTTQPPMKNTLFTMEMIMTMMIKMLAQVKGALYFQAQTAGLLQIVDLQTLTIQSLQLFVELIKILEKTNCVAVALKKKKLSHPKSHNLPYKTGLGLVKIKQRNVQDGWKVTPKFATLITLPLVS